MRRIFSHLLPRSATWALSPGKALTAFFDGLSGVFAEAKTYADLVYLVVKLVNLDAGGF